MKNLLLTLLALALLCGAALAAPDSLRCQMVDWMDAPSHHDFLHESYDYDHGYWYSGTSYWDLAMGDSIMVWLSGGDSVYFVNATDYVELEVTFSYDFGSAYPHGAVAYDSIFYIVGGVFVVNLLYGSDSLAGFDYFDYIYTPWADFRNAAIEDSFLYTVNFEGGGGTSGMEVNANGLFGAVSGSGTWGPYYVYPYWRMEKIDMFSGDTAFLDTAFSYHDRSLGDIASNDSLVFYVNSMMSHEGEEPPWEIGQSNLYVFERDYTHAFYQRWFGQGAFGVDVLNDHLIAVGFEHGFSVLNIDSLDDIREVAYYMNEDSVMDFTHFAMKDSRIYAMGHPRAGYARLYMFDVGDTVATGQAEAELPEEFRFWNYPNPFNSDCRFAIEWASPNKNAKLDIFDVTGRIVFTDKLILQSGENLYRWAPENLPSGVYLARITANDTSATSKLVFLQ